LWKHNHTLFERSEVCWSNFLSAEFSLGLPADLERRRTFHAGKGRSVFTGQSHKLNIAKFAMTALTFYEKISGIIGDKTFPQNDNMQL
jgi:hypothetical protein